MLIKLNELETTVNTSARNIFSTQSVNAGELETIKEKGLSVVEDLERLIDDEIEDDVQSLRTKLEAVDPNTNTDAYLTLMSLISMSDKIENVKVFLDEDE